MVVNDRLTFLGWMERAKSGIQPLHIISRLKHQRDTDVMTATYIKILARHTSWLVPSILSEVQLQLMTNI